MKNDSRFAGRLDGPGAMIIGFLVGAFVLSLFPGGAAAKSESRNTKHDLSTTGPGPFKSDVETRICVFCHAPHNAVPSTPLWNKALQALNYDPYASSTLHLT